MNAAETALAPEHLFSIPGLAAWEWEPASGALRWSPSLKQLYGVSGEPSSDLDFMRLIHPDDRLRVEAEITALLECGGPFEHAFRLVRPDGEVRHILDRGVALRDAHGSVTRLVGVNIDLTDQERQAAAARREAAALSHLFAVNEVIRSCEDPQDLLDRVAALLGRYLGAAQIRMGERREGGIVGRAAWRPAGAQAPDGYWPRELAEALDGHGVTATAGDLHAEARLVASADRGLDRSPFVVVSAPGPRAWSESEIQVARETCERLWSALDRLESEARLREREERLRAALEASGTGTFRWDIRSGALEWDEALDRLFGLEPGETARSLEQFVAMVHPEDREAVVAACIACRDQGLDFDMAFRIVTPEGEVRWLYDRGRVIPGPDGRPSAMTGACVDVTARRAVEDQLRASETRFRTLAETMPSFAFIADASGANTYTNATYQRAVGLSGEDLLGFGFLKALHPDDAPRVGAVWRAALERGDVYEVEMRFILADGSVRWHLARGLPLRGPAGEVEAWFGTAIDIQDMVDARETLTRSNQDLEAVVAKRTEEILHLQKLESLGQLTGGVAHDFNNLLTPIIGALDLLQRRPADEARARRMIDGALQAAERARVLVSRLLSFARRQHLNAEVVDIRGLIEGMRDLIDRSIGPTIRTEVRCAPDLPPVRVDANQLELALLNLAVNARDAMPGGGELVIEAAAERIGPGHPASLPPGDYVGLAVCDTGMGMDEETLARAVEPFFSTKEVGEGTGLGLSMAHGLAAQSGGALTLQSRPGEGTRATIWLPRSREVQVSAPPEADELPLLGRPGEALVLLVDDEASVRDTTAEMLRHLGYAVRHAAGAAEALALLEAGLRPSLLLTDYLMPAMGGVELARRARRLRPDLPVLVISGYSRPTDPWEFPRLQKPFRVHELGTAVAEALA